MRTNNLYHTIAFYNLENLFDTKDDKHTNDDAFLPKSERNWTPRRYNKKLRKLGYTISNIGRDIAQKPPSIVGLAEVENKKVIEDLLNSKFLKSHHYQIVHFDSPDERGIDVALIFDSKVFKLTHSEVYPVVLLDENGQPDYTRDILKVEGKLNNEKIYLLVNHWPSRRLGVDETEPSRIMVSKKVSEIIEQIQSIDTDPKIIIMGDFNDDPKSESVQRLINSHDLFNPMQQLISRDRGSLNHRFEWNLFDQIFFSTNFFETKLDQHSYSKADIFDDTFLTQYKGKYKGNPYRTYVGTKYKGGYSDHFPVYILLKKNGALEF